MAIYRYWPHVLATAVGAVVLALAASCGRNEYVRVETTMKTEERTGVVAGRSGPLTLLGPDVKVGDPAPDFAVVDAAFKPVHLNGFAGKTVIVSSVPSLDTKVCSTQTRRFNEEAAKLPATVAVVTVSMDLPFAQSRFCEAEKVGRTMVFSDHVWRDYGMKYGLLIKETGLLARAVYVISPDRKVVYRQIVPELGTEPDYAAALAAARQSAM